MTEQEEIFKYQDKMVSYVIEAKELQNKTGWKVGLAMNNQELIPVDNILKSMEYMTTREDIKTRIKKTLEEEQSK